MRDYIVSPSDIRSLSENDAKYIELVKNTTYSAALEKGKTFFGNNAKLICTIEFKNTAINEVSLVSDKSSTNISFHPNDQCYPISKDEWDIFLSEEDEKLRTSMEVWAVDGRRYTAPI